MFDVVAVWVECVDEVGVEVVVPVVVGVGGGVVVEAEDVVVVGGPPVVGPVVVFALVGVVGQGLLPEGEALGVGVDGE